MQEYRLRTTTYDNASSKLHLAYFSLGRGNGATYPNKIFCQEGHGSVRSIGSPCLQYSENPTPTAPEDPVLAFGPSRTELEPVNGPAQTELEPATNRNPSESEPVMVFVPAEHDNDIVIELGPIAPEATDSPVASSPMTTVPVPGVPKQAIILSVDVEGGCSGDGEQVVVIDDHKVEVITRRSFLTAIPCQCEFRAFKVTIAVGT